MAVGRQLTKELTQCDSLNVLLSVQWALYLLAVKPSHADFGRKKNKKKQAL